MKRKLIDVVSRLYRSDDYLVMKDAVVSALMDSRLLSRTVNEPILAWIAESLHSVLVRESDPIDVDEKAERRGQRGFTVMGFSITFAHVPYVVKNPEHAVVALLTRIDMSLDGLACTHAGKAVWIPVLFLEIKVTIPAELERLFQD